MYTNTVILLDKLKLLGFVWLWKAVATYSKTEQKFEKEMDHRKRMFNQW